MTGLLPSTDTSESHPQMSEKTSTNNQGNRSYFPCEKIPTQEVPETGVRYDFNAGARILIPHDNQKYFYRVDNNDTHTTIISGEFQKNKDDGSESDKGDPWSIFTIRQQYFMNLRIRVWIFNDTENPDEPWEEILDESFSAKNKNVLVHMPRGALGDTLAWFPYIIAFGKKHECNLTVIMKEDFSHLWQKNYPEITIIDPQDNIDQKKFYATYRVGVFYHDDNNTWSPRDYRFMGLHHIAAEVLGLPHDIQKTKIVATQGKILPPEQPYVCIAVQSTMKAKLWNNPQGWIVLVNFLIQSGYRVLCIDRERATGKDANWNTIPFGCEDWTGARPLTERADLLSKAAFFVGLPSGLSWLAWSVDCPTVMIAGFSDESAEFKPTIRIQNPIPCHSCWSDNRVMFDTSDYFWCPRHKGTSRAYECSTQILPEQVISAIQSSEIYTKTAPVRAMKNDQKQ